jgi:rhodanese-related sulfurtransferase
MPFRRVPPAEAKELMDKEGYLYLDVRSVPEFEAGHPQDAYNIPLMHMGPAGMAPNPDFLLIVERNFPKDTKLVVGCKAGGRSMRACAMLEAAGFTNLVDQRAGFDGGPDAAGNMEPGWRPLGLPTSRVPAPAHDYTALTENTR